MSGEDKPDPAASSWDLRNDDHSFFFSTDDYKESSILSEFGWNIPPEPSGASSFANFAPIEAVTASGSTEAAAAMEASPSNRSASSSSSEERPEKSASASADPPPDDAAGKTTKKKGQKRVRQPRFAFVTKSEVDHLEDGYRWRKYGQKAVKNSPFPRSYYRCTNSKCMVKKRIERSSEDPSVVITTYEGQHCHYTVGYPRGGGGGGAGLPPPHDPTAPFPSNFFNNTNSHLLYPPRLHHPLPRAHAPVPVPVPAPARGEPSATTEAGSSRLPPPGTGEGLLGDIVPPRMRNNG